MVVPGNYGLFAATRRDNFIVWTFSVKSMTRFNVSATMGNGADSADREHYMEYSLNVGASQEKVKEIPVSSDWSRENRGSVFFFVGPTVGLAALARFCARVCG